MYPFSSHTSTKNKPYPSFFTPFEFDVHDVISRTALAMAKSGVKICEAKAPHCDVNPDKIYLPQAIKKKVNSDELALIRFLFLHELGHIQHTPVDRFKSYTGIIVNEVKCKGLRIDPVIAHAILNSLEDIRMESKIAGAYGGSNYVVSNGRRICIKMWAKNIENVPEDQWLRNAVVEEIYGAYADIDGLLHKVERKNEEIDVLMNVVSILDEFYARIDALSYPKSSWEDVESLSLAIALKFAESKEERQRAEMDRKDPDQPKTPSLQGKMDYDKANRIAEGLTESTNGMIEEVSMNSDLFQHDIEHDSDGKPIPDSKYAAVKDMCGNLSKRIARAESVGASHDGVDGLDYVHDDSNFKVGVRMASGAQRLIDLFRGMVSSKYQKPKQSGLRIARHKIAPFLKKQTLNILRSKGKTVDRSLAVSFLVDDSGSMRDNTWGESKDESGRLRRSVTLTDAVWTAAALLGIACDRARVPFQILRFGNDFSRVKDFNESVHSKKFLFAMRCSGGTEITNAIAYAGATLSERGENNRVMFCFSDECLADERDAGVQIKAAIQGGVRVVAVLFDNHCPDETRRKKFEGVWKRSKAEVIWLNQVDLESGRMGSVLVERLCSIIA